MDSKPINYILVDHNKDLRTYNSSASSTNGPIEKGRPAFVLVGNTHSTIGQELGKVQGSKFNEKYDLIKRCLIKTNTQSEAKSIDQMKIFYTTDSVDSNYTGPVALVIPEMHLADSLEQSPQVRTEMEKNFEANVLFLKQLALSKKVTHYIQEGLSKPPKLASNFTMKDAINTCSALVSISGIKDIEVNASERIDGYLEHVIQGSIYNLIVSQLDENDPGNVYSSRLEYANRFLQGEGISDSKTFIEKKYEELISELQLLDYIEYNKEDFSLKSKKQFLKMNPRKLRHLVEYLQHLMLATSIQKRDQETRLSFTKLKHNGIIPVIVGALHTPNLVINELERMGIPTLVVSNNRCEHNLQNMFNSNKGSHPLTDLDKPELRSKIINDKLKEIKARRLLEHKYHNA